MGLRKTSCTVLNPFFKGYRYHVSGLHHGPIGFPTEDAKIGGDLIDRLFNKIESKQDIINENEEMDLESAEIIIIAYGSVSLAVKEALKDYNKESKQKVGFFST